MKCIDLFSGCGGMSLGFAQTGYEILAAIDNWKPALEVYRDNFSHPVYSQDIADTLTTLKILNEFNPDLIMGGPPCQDFSSAGKRDQTLGRADLTNHFASVVCDFTPEWFVMENVEQIKTSKIFLDVVKQFIEKGYGLSSVILDASLCGVPQARTRLFLIGHYGDSHNQLNQIIKDRLASKQMTIREYLGDKLGVEFYYRHPRNYNRRGVFSIDEPSPTVRGVNRPIPKGYRINTCDPKGVALSEIRPLTTKERSLIQTFPVDFIFNGTKTNLEQMIGNAVPVNLASFIAESIDIYRKNGRKRLPSLFDDFIMPDSDNEQFVFPNRTLHRT